MRTLFPSTTLFRSKCVCNGLPTTVGLGQVRSKSGAELSLVTAGDDLAQIAQFLTPGRDTYSAADVLRQLLAEPQANPGGTSTGQSLA
jgi:nitronate monooxygenase